jgi:hypothetical protein
VRAHYARLVITNLILLFAGNQAIAQDAPPDQVRIQLSSTMFSSRSDSTYRIEETGTTSNLTSPIHSSAANLTGLSMTPSVLVNVTNSLSVSMGIPYIVRLQAAQSTSRDSVGDAFAGLNYVIPKLADALPTITVGGQISAPTAGTNFGTGRWGMTGTVTITQSINDKISIFALGDFTKFVGSPSEPLRPDWAVGWGGGIRSIVTERIELVAAATDVATSYLTIGAGADKSVFHNVQLSLTGLLYDAGIPWLGLTLGVDQLQGGHPGLFGTVRFVAFSY